MRVFKKSQKEMLWCLVSRSRLLFVAVAVFALRADVDIVGALILSNLQEMLFPFSYKKKKSQREHLI